MLKGFIDSYGLFAIFITQVFESALIPIPSEIVLPLGGFLAAQGYFSLFSLMLVASLANLLGAILAYYLGTKMTWIHKIIFLEDHLKMSQRFFDKFGIKTIFVARMMPVVRTFISLPAGLAKVPVWEFSFFTFLGSLPWNFILGYLGYILGQNWELVHNYGNYLTILVIIALPMLYVLYRKYEEKLME